MNRGEKAYECFDLLAVDEAAVRAFEIEKLDPSFFAHLKNGVDSRERRMLRNDIRHIRISA